MRLMIDAQITVYCEICDKVLNGRPSPDGDEGTIFVLPCAVCKEKEYGLGKEQGRKEAKATYDEGYKLGYEQGKRWMGG